MSATKFPTVSVQKKLKQILDIDTNKTTAMQLEKIEDFLLSNAVREFIKKNNKKTFLGKTFAAIGKNSRLELVKRAVEVVEEVREKLDAAKKYRDARAKKSALVNKLAAGALKNKLNKASKKIKKPLLSHAKPRNLPSSKPSRMISA